MELHHGITEREFYKKHKGERFIVSTVDNQKGCVLIGYYTVFDCLVFTNNDGEEFDGNTYEEIKDMIPNMTLCKTIKSTDIIVFAYMDEIK